MKSEAELKAVTQFVAEYATRLMGSGVHTSRVVRNTKRLGEALGVRVMVSAFQKVVTFSVYDDESGRVYRTPATSACPLPRFGAAMTRSSPGRVWTRFSH